LAEGKVDAAAAHKARRAAIQQVCVSVSVCVRACMCVLFGVKAEDVNSGLVLGVVGKKGRGVCSMVMKC